MTDNTDSSDRAEQGNYAEVASSEVHQATETGDGADNGAQNIGNSNEPVHVASSQDTSGGLPAPVVYNASSSGGGDISIEFTDVEKKRMSFWITEKMAYRPWTICALMFTFILMIVVIVGATGMAAITTGSQYDWDVPTSEESKNNDALTDATDRVDLLGSSGVRTQVYDFPFIFIHTSRDGTDLFTPDNLQDMCNVEATLTMDSEFPNYCQLDSQGECILSGASVVVYFYGFQNLSSWNCSLLSTSEVDQKKAVIYDSMSTTVGVEQYGLWLSQDAISLGYSTKAESVWSFGAPLAGYETPADRDVEQFEKYKSLVTGDKGEVAGVEETLFDFFDIETNADNFLAFYPSPYMSNAYVGTVESQWFSIMNQQNEFARLVGSDLFFATFSILFVLLWLRVHTKSTFIALLGMFMIFCSLPFSIFFYKGIYRIPFFTELHSLVLFIVLGVGADDIFVLVDSWKDTAVMYPGDVTDSSNRALVHRRLFHCYEHTMATVFNTSFTTAMAFISTGFSPLMPIATFGWFAATCIVVNYLFVITLMPPVVVLSDVYFSKCCVSSAQPKPVEKTATVPIQTEAESDLEMVQKNYAIVRGADVDSVVLGDDTADAVSSNVGSGDGKHNVPNQSDAASDVAGIDSKQDDGEVSAILAEKKLMVDAYISVMNTKVPVGGEEGVFGFRNFYVCACMVFVALFVFGIVGMAYGTQLEPPAEQEVWLPLKHMFTKVEDSLFNGFLGFDESAFETITLTMGIAGIDRSGFNRFKPAENRGNAVFDSAWDLSSTSCQQVVLRMCDDVQTYPCTVDGCSGGMLARTNTTECFMSAFRTWANDTYDEDTFTMNSSHFYSRLSTFRETQSQTLNNYESWQDQIGFIDSDLKFASIFFTSTMKTSVSGEEKLGVEEVILDFIDTVKAYPECNSCDCESLRFTSPYAFTWMRSEMGLVKGFYQGLLIAFPVAFLVLIYATQNILITLYAIVSVAFIVFGVLGFANYALGWSLGVAESIAGIIIIGFSVDYTVHLGHMYTHGEEVGLHTRDMKFKFASKKMVATVVGGAITTIGAGVFMFACQLQFFVKMAVLIVSTILLSYLYSLGFFMSTLVLFGPEHEQGNVFAIAKKLADQFK